MDITVQKLDEMRKSGDPHMLLDVREIPEVAICSIDGSVHIPMNEIPAKLAELPTDKPLVVMCHVGGRSFQVTQWLSGSWLCVRCDPGKDRQFRILVGG